MRDLKLAIRTLSNAPLVTAVAILSLALGIGANAGIYSMFHEMLLAPLPVAQPDRLVNLDASNERPGNHSCGIAGDCDVIFSYPMFRDLEQSHPGLTGVAAHVILNANVAYHGQTLNGNAELVSGSYFPVLGVRPAAGRLFTVDDDKVIGGHPLAVLSYGFWQDRLGADPAVVGQTIIVNGQSLTIIGVSARGFEGTTLGSRPYLFVPLTMRGLMIQGWTGFENRTSYWAYVFARLAPGVSMTQAQASMNVGYRRIINEVEAPLQKGISTAALGRFKANVLTLEDGRRGQSDLHKETEAPLLMLFSITAIVLLIACANVANLLLARSAGRALEMGVRLSLGASRWQLVRQLLTESLVLSVMGGLAGLLVAAGTLRLIMALLPGEITDAMSFALSGSSIAFAAALAVGTGIAFGLFPALESTRPDLVTSLRNASGKTSASRSAARFRTSLVTAQIALSMALLVSAGLFIKSLRNVSRVDLGIQLDQLVTFHVSPVLNGYAPARSRQFFSDLEDRLAALPGVTAVSAARIAILDGDNWDNSVNVQGFVKLPDTDADASYNGLGPGYFALLGVPVLSGREFTRADALGAPRVAIVNEAFAKKFGLGRDAVGKLMGLSHGDTDSLNIQIVGLVKNATYSNVKGKIPPIYFLPYRQDSTVGGLTFYVRGTAQPQAIMPQIRGVVKSLDPNLPVTELKTMPQQVRDNVFLDRMIGTLSAAFAALATVLAAVGLYGVLAYTVTQRTREIGVRIALGADSARIQGMVLRQVAVMTVIGAVIGLAGALALGRVAKSLLFEITANDPVVMGIAVVLLAAVAFSAGYLPARRASRTDPMQALRYE